MNIFLDMHANKPLSSERNSVFHVCRLKERPNVIDVFSITHIHGLLVLESRELKDMIGTVFAQTLTHPPLRGIVSDVGDKRMLSR